MGIVHFAGLGRSPGAITSGLCYLENNKEMFKDEFKGEIIESVVIFTSTEIVKGIEKAFPETTDNEYMRRSSRVGWTKSKDNALEIVKEFIQNEFKCEELHYITVNPFDFSECFEAVARALLKFHSPGKVGKHIWANITGGTNILNLALTQVAYLSGFIPVFYYTFIGNLREDVKYLRPFSEKSEEFDFRRFWILKTKFDERVLHIYEELKKYKNGIEDEMLLSRLKSKYPEFANVEIESFRRDFLNVMVGIGRADTCNWLTQNGEEMLKILNSPLVKALTRRERVNEEEIEVLCRDLNMVKLNLR